MVGGISGVDINDIVDGLMSYKKKGLERMNQKQSVYDYQKSAYSELKKQLEGLEQSFSDFKNILNKNHYQGQSGNEDIVSVALNAEQLATGIYDIDVTQLARAQQTASQAYSSKTDALGLSSDLTVDVQGNSMTLNLSADDSLETLQNKINQAADNPGVYASILKVTGAGGADEFRLMLSATETGTDYSLNLSGDAVSDLDLTDEVTAAQNALLTFNGFQVERNGNLINDILDGVSLNLNGSLGQTQLTISDDQSSKQEALSAQMQKFVDNYNGIMEMSAKNKADSYLRDNSIGIIQKSMQSMISGSYGDGGIQQFFELGLTTAKAQTTTNKEGVEYAVTGRIDFDSAKFQEAIAENSTAVDDFFNDNSTGFAKVFSEQIYHIEQETIYNRESIINDQLHSIGDRIYREENRLESVRESLVKQYLAVEEIVSRYEQIGNYLDQQLELLNNNHNKK